MIVATDLMIGNWVSCNLLHRPFNAQIIEIRKDAVIVSQGGDLESGYTYGNISPIPITPELLEKCGFMKNDCDRMILECGNDFALGKHLMNDCVSVYYGENNTGLGVEYLHTLQNVFYFLTGIPLTVKI